MPRLRSVLWKYFDKTSPEFHAICTLCGKLLSYKSTNGNLRNHLKRLHVKAFHQYLEEKNETQENADGDRVDNESVNDLSHVLAEEDSNHSNSDLASLWNHFEQLSPSRARCTACKIVIDILDMQDHLRTKHPTLAEDQESDVGTEAQNNGEDETYTEIIYLDENFSQNKLKTYDNPLKKRKSEVIYKTSRVEKKDDELDKFLTYISCLMKNMPKEVTDVLQMEIITLIMREKMKLTQKPAETNQPMNISFNTPSTSSNNVIILTNDNVTDSDVGNNDSSFKNE